MLSSNHHGLEKLISVAFLARLLFVALHIWFASLLLGPSFTVDVFFPFPFPGMA